jgi:hypothetical protein
MLRLLLTKLKALGRGELLSIFIPPQIFLVGLAPMNIISLLKRIATLIIVNIVGTSRKHSIKEPQLFSHRGSFDHPDLQSLNECRLVFLDNIIIFGITTSMDTLLYLFHTKNNGDNIVGAQHLPIHNIHHQNPCCRLYYFHGLMK